MSLVAGTAGTRGELQSGFVAVPISAEYDRMGVAAGLERNEARRSPLGMSRYHHNRQPLSFWTLVFCDSFALMFAVGFLMLLMMRWIGLS